MDREGKLVSVLKELATPQILPPNLIPINEYTGRLVPNGVLQSDGNIIMMMRVWREAKSDFPVIRKIARVFINIHQFLRATK